MRFDFSRARSLLQNGDLGKLFVEELGWEPSHKKLTLRSSQRDFTFSAIAEKRGFTAWICESPNGQLPDHTTRLKLDRELTQTSFEHLVIFATGNRTRQSWMWVRREPGKPLSPRTHEFIRGQPGDSLLQKLQVLYVSLEEEEKGELSTITMAGRARAAFDLERVTKNFYRDFDSHRKTFLEFIDGIGDVADREWYASVMLNRLMFVYFIQRKGFLDGHHDYLRHRLQRCQKEKGKDKFYTFYRYFLLRLFHEGFGKQRKDRAPDLEKLLGNIPYLNGGLFDIHDLEKPERYGEDIQIPDKAFERVFDYFDKYQWHLDERPLRKDDEINPDVLGYIFEKYINQKQMGAYYTKEDITEYISKNTVLPFLFDSARAKCKVAFESPDSPTIWDLLRENPDRYIYSAVRHGLTWNYIPDHPSEGEPLAKHLDLPANIADGLDTSRSDLIDVRKAWNKPAPAGYALPTEIWREVVARRHRYEEVKKKLAVGEVCDINDFITLNLDLRQFAQDVVQNCEGPDLLMAFWQAISTITVLDPTGGSGAFIFAALNILDPLYEASLDRMEAFLAEWGENGRKAHPNYYKKFTDVLARVAAHPNRRYFVLKSIILNNLYAVDIMEEAVEICKLRLFLKLAAQVEPNTQHPNLGIEPLPDIDFNIRAGNSLVGYATADEVRRSMKEDSGGQMKLMGEEDLGSFARFNLRCADVEDAFRKFRQLQTEGDGSVPAADKKGLQTRLKTLEDELNCHLAGEYGIKVSNKSAYAKWLKSHQPFHWFIEFYGIINSGGFDVVIGNPPYVELKDVSSYSVRGYSTTDCGDLYNLCLERSANLTRPNAALGFIVPLSAFSVAGFKSFQDFYYENNEMLWVSHWSGDAHPAKLFEGVDKRLEIVLSRRKRQQLCRIFTSNYLKWYSDERPELFNVRPFYWNLSTDRQLQFSNTSLMKIQTNIEYQILKKIRAQPLSIEMVTTEIGDIRLYFTRKVSFFLQFLDFIPEIKDSKGRNTEPSELKVLSFTNRENRDMALASLSSDLFYWFNVVNSDCRNLNKREILGFRIPRIPDRTIDRLAGILTRLMESYRKNSTHKTVFYKNVGNVTVQYFNFRPSKPIIDEIDTVLASHYGFTTEELDFILNYDIKYRVGRETESEEE